LGAKEHRRLRKRNRCRKRKGRAQVWIIGLYETAGIEAESMGIELSFKSNNHPIKVSENASDSHNQINYRQKEYAPPSP